MLNKTKILLACSVFAFSNVALARAGTSEAPATTATTTAQPSADTIIQNRIEKAKAGAEYKMEKKVAKQEYTAMKKEANLKLKMATQLSSTGTNVEGSK